jgi:hypothetical protein
MLQRKKEFRIAFFSLTIPWYDRSLYPSLDNFAACAAFMQIQYNSFHHGRLAISHGAVFYKLRQVPYHGSYTFPA